jgi:hypothetical protein
VKLSLQHLAPHLGRSLGITPERLLSSFRPAVPADLARILDFRREVSGGVWWDDAAYVRWRYFDSRFAAGPAPYWIFEREGQIIGGVGLEPVVLVVDGEPHDAVRSMDIMVRPDFDGRGLGVLMSLIHFEKFPIILVTGSNARSHNLLTRLFQNPLELCVWKMLVRSRHFISRHVNLGVFTGAAAFAGDAILAFDRRRRRGRSTGNWEVRELAAFDAQATMLSRSCEGKGSVFVRRSADYLNWRLMRNPRCDYRVHGAFLNSVLVGYVVSALSPAGQDHDREGVIADWLAAPSADGTVDPLPTLMRVAVDRLISDGATVVRCLAYGSDTDQMIEGAGFRSRPERIPFFIRASDEALQDRLAAGGGWFLTSGDYDVE